jgi:hypothetical protein
MITRLFNWILEGFGQHRTACFIFSTLPNSMYCDRVGRRRRSVRTCATRLQCVTSRIYKIKSNLAVNKLCHHQVNNEVQFMAVRSDSI